MMHIDQTCELSGTASGQETNFETESFCQNLRRQSFQFLCLLLVSAAFLIGRPATAQVQNGTIRGTVTDSRGAVVPDAIVTLTQKATSLVLHGQTNEVGVYSFPQLLLGDYSVAVEKQGFRREVESLTLTVGQVAEVDLVLSVGSETATVIVEGENSAALDTQTSNIDYTVQENEVDDLPLNGRNPYGTAIVAPGIAAGQATFGVGIAIVRESSVASGTNNFESNGGIGGSNEVLLDGVSTVVCCQGQPAVVPSVEFVSQFKVVTSDPSAQYGRTSGAVLNVATKSGTNQFHGDAYDFLRNNKLDAANFFTKRNGIYPFPGIPDFRNPHRENQFGSFIGGPVVLPRVYNGKDRTFFFMGYEGVRNYAPTVATLTVPTALMREGIFTEAPSVVYSPTSYNSGTGTRTPIPAATCNGTAYSAGYCIPSSEFNVAAQAMMAWMPPPNLPGTVNNYQAVETIIDADNQSDIRIDHNFSDKQRAFIRGSRVTDHHFQYDLFNKENGLNGWKNHIGGYLFAIGDTWTLSPTAVLQFSYGFARQTNAQIFNSFFGFNAADYGFSSQFASEEQVAGLPYLSFSGLQNLGYQNSFNNWAHYTHSLNASALLQHGKHSIAVGYNGRLILENQLGLVNPTGSFAFNTQFTGGPSPNSALPSGQSAFDSWAAFLLGYPGSGSISRQTTPAFSQWITGLYLQDDWRVIQKLTLNLGLRWDVETGFHERHNEWGDFNPIVTNPISSQVGINTLGGVEFMGAGGNPSRLWPTFYHEVGPRLGFSYALTQKTVVRGGYGILYLPTSERGYSDSNVGFSATTNMATSATGFTPVVTLDNAFPTGVSLPAGASAGPGAGVGSTLAGFEYNNPVSYQQQWNLGVERALATGMSVSVNYVGGHGVDLPQSVRLSDLNPSYFGSVGSASQVSYLEAQVNNPFYGATGLAPGSLLANPTVERAQLLNAFPQYDGGAITGIQDGSVQVIYLDHGSVTYNALQATWLVTHRGGLTGSVSYVWSKLLGNVSDLTNGFSNETGNPGIQDYYLMHQYEHSNLVTDTPQRVTGTATYPLPFGKGKRFGGNMPSWANEVSGGWTLSSIIDVYSGFPSSLTVSGNPAFSGTRPVYVPGVNPLNSGSTYNRLGGYFNKAAFTLPQSFQMGDVPRSAAALRGPLSFDDNLSVIKYLPIHEDLGMELRGDAFNILNRPEFGLPNATFGSSSFGKITSQNNLPRNVQVSMKVRF